MFEHLDDHEGYRPSPTTLAVVQREGRRRRRRAHLARSGVVGAAAVAFGAGAVALRLDGQLDSVDRVEVASLTAPDPSPAAPYTILFTGLAGGEPLDPGGRMAASSDTIALVRVFPAEDRVTYLSLPRDLWVDLPGHGAGRINSALAIDGGSPGLLITALRELGVEVNHYVQLDFAGARAIGDAVGGLRFDFDQPVRDRTTGLDVPEAGCHTLDSAQLLAFARARHLEVETEPGVWVVDATADLGRMARQHQVALAGLAAFSTLDPADPLGVDRFADAVVDHVVVDALTTREQLIDLFRDVAGSRLEPRWLPVEAWSRPDGAEVLVPATDGSFDRSIEQFTSGDVQAAAGDLPAGVAAAVVPTAC